jgi:tripartite-type tricarboxylate transporter receptor subunit TctC
MLTKMSKRRALMSSLFAIDNANLVLKTPARYAGCNKTEGEDVMKAAGIGLVLTVLTASVLAPDVRAQGYPNQPIKLVVGFAAGGPTDVVARVVGKKLGSILGQSVVVENRTGASGNIATQAVANARADGYTLLLGSNSNAVNQSLFKSLPFNFSRDFEAVAPLAEAPTILVVHPSLPVRSVAELIAAARAQPDTITFGTAGKGTTTQLAGELFNLTTGAKLVPVPYRGGADAVKDLITGQIKVMFSPIPPVLPFLANKQILALASTGPQRSPVVPDLPTVAESGLPGFDMRMWFGLVAPAKTPVDVVAKLHAATKEVLDDAEVKSALAQQGFTPLYGSPEEFARYIKDDIDRWEKVNKAMGNTIE